MVESFFKILRLQIIVNYCRVDFGVVSTSVGSGKMLEYIINMVMLYLIIFNLACLVVECVQVG